VELPDVDTEISKHVGVQIIYNIIYIYIYIYFCDINFAFVGYNTNKLAILF